MSELPSTSTTTTRRRKRPTLSPLTFFSKRPVTTPPCGVNYPCEGCGGGASEILQGRLWISNQQSVEELIQRHCILRDNVIVVADELQSWAESRRFHRDCLYDVIPHLDGDDGYGATLETVLRCALWIQDHIKMDCGPVVVCCAKGINRSVSVVIAYLCIFEKMSFSAAYETVEQQRCVASPLLGYCILLTRLEEKIVEMDDADDDGGDPASEPWIFLLRTMRSTLQPPWTPPGPSPGPSSP